MKTITAQAWKLGVVGLAFVLAFTMLISSTPSQTAQAAVGETTTCTIAITETDQAVLVDGAGFDSSTVLITIDNTNTTLISEGTVITNGATGEKMLVVGVPTSLKVLVRRGHLGTIAGALAQNTQLLYRAAATANSPLTCMGDTSSDMTVTIKSAEAGVTAKIAVDRFSAATNSAQVVEHRTNGGSMTDATQTITLDSNVGLTANDYIVNSGTGEIVKIGALTGGATLTTVLRGQMGTTAAAFVEDSYWTDLAMVLADFADANQVVPKVNGLSSRDTVAEEVSVALDTFTAATSTAAAYYSGTATLSSATAGEAIISVKGPNSGPKYITDPDTSSNLLHVNFRGAPVSYKDADVNGAFDGSDVARSTIFTPVSVPGQTTSFVRIDAEDSIGQQLVGQITFNLSTAACDAGVTWSGSGKCDLVITTTNTPGTNSGDETVNIKGLASTGNFRYSYTATYSGASGDFDYANSTDAADMIIFRTNNVVSTLTSSLKLALADNTEASTDAVQSNGIAAVADNDATELYYVEVIATDSAGNPAAASITVKDLDGDGTDGLGTALDISFEETGNAAVTKVTANAAGKAIFWVRHATIYTASASDPKLGTYPLEFYYTSNSAIATNITVDVRSAAKTFAITATSGQNDDGSLPTGTVGTWTITATDINGTRISADAAVTFIVTGMGTGATAGSFVPTNNALTVDDVNGGVVSIVAPTVAGTGTVAVIYGGKVVTSTALTFGAAAETAGATVSGTGCTASTTGSYTCVVTEGGTAAEVATASSAVSVWQSDASGVLQGYVVGTPDFVDTGLASDAVIADSSAVIVVR